MFDRLAKIIVEYADAEIEDIKPDTNIRSDLGIDSYELINLVGAIEKEFNISVSDREIVNLITPEDIIKYIEAHK